MPSDPSALLLGTPEEAEDYRRWARGRDASTFAVPAELAASLVPPGMGSNVAQASADTTTPLDVTQAQVQPPGAVPPVRARPSYAPIDPAPPTSFARGVSPYELTPSKIDPIRPDPTNAPDAAGLGMKPAVPETVPADPVAEHFFGTPEQIQSRVLAEAEHQRLQNVGAAKVPTEGSWQRTNATLLPEPEPTGRVGLVERATNLLGMANLVAPLALAASQELSNNNEAGDIRHMSQNLGLGPLTAAELGQRYSAYLSANPEVAKQLYDEGVLSTAAYRGLGVVAGG